MELIEIPAGKFTMGSPEDEKDHCYAEAQVTVTLTKPFGLGKTEVTQGQFKKVMDTEPWSGEDFVKADKDFPATYVDWIDATKFCQKLTEIERNAGKLKANEEYRLPTEAEWEYACRAGTETAFSFGNDESKLGDYAWFKGNVVDVDELYAHKVGMKRPNPWGLHDMHGNVWEFCSDWYGEALSGGTDPVGPNGRYMRIFFVFFLVGNQRQDITRNGKRSLKKAFASHRLSFCLTPPRVCRSICVPEQRGHFEMTSPFGCRGKIRNHH